MYKKKKLWLNTLKKEKKEKHQDGRQEPGEILGEVLQHPVHELTRVRALVQFLRKHTQYTLLYYW